MWNDPYITVTVHDEITGEAFYLDYCIVEDQISLPDSFGVVTFGVAVQMRRANKIEQVMTPSLYTFRSGVEDFIRCLARNEVTPTTFMDIVEDGFGKPVERQENQLVLTA